MAKKKGKVKVAKKVTRKVAKKIAKKSPRKVVKKATKAAKVAAKKAKRGRGRPRGMGPAPREFKDRFQKFYFVHRGDLNNERRRLYLQKKARGICVRCKRKVVKGSVFCADHRKRSRK